MVVAVDGGTIESIRDAVQCWIHDERRCVTTRRICLEFGTTRKQATEVLESIVASTAGQGGDDADSDAAVDERQGYEVTRCLVVVEKAEGKSQDRKMTVVKLVTNIVSAGSNDDAPRKGEGSIYSVSAFTGPPPKPRGAGPPLSDCRLHAAHESDRVRERDALRGSGQEDASCAGGVGGIRPPSPLMGALAKSSGGAARVYNTGVTSAYSTTQGSRASTSPRGALAAAKRKKTTAADFFGPSSSSDTAKEKGSGGKRTKSKRSEPSTATVKLTKDQDRQKQHNGTHEAEVDADTLSSSSRQRQQKGPEKRRDFRPGRKEDGSARAMSVGAAKEASSGGSAVGKKNGSKNEIVGNADDFVGDVEEDDSSDEEETMGNPKSRNNVKKNRQGSMGESESEGSDGDDFLSKPRSKKKKNTNGSRSQANANGGRKGAGATRQKRQKKTAPLSDNGDSEGDGGSQPEPTVGAMDSFVAHEARGGGDGVSSLDGNGRQQQHPDGKRRRRQRKTFQERTTMDEHGYMHTETVCVMEDIPSDEEEDENDKNGVKRGGGTSAYAGGAKKVKKGAAPSAATNAKGKKQAGLMGFFAVKKKK